MNWIIKVLLYIGFCLAIWLGIHQGIQVTLCWACFWPDSVEKMGIEKRAESALAKLTFANRPALRFAIAVAFCGLPVAVLALFTVAGNSFH
ncbi:hypothetical protein GLV89_13210 [Halomonas alkaliantarctica]|nr:hypothetical protein [Halomonas alkaliantarctica]